MFWRRKKLTEITKKTKQKKGVDNETNVGEKKIKMPLIDFGTSYYFGICLVNFTSCFVSFQEFIISFMINNIHKILLFKTIFPFSLSFANIKIVLIHLAHFMFSFVLFYFFYCENVSVCLLLNCLCFIHLFICIGVQNY